MKKKSEDTTSETNSSGLNSKKALLICIVVLVVIIVIAGMAYGALSPSVTSDQTTSAAQSDEEEKTEAPDIEITDSDGNQVQLSDFRGKPVVLNFWASTCGPCQMEMPEFQKAFEQYGDQVDFIMLNVVDFNGETRESAERAIAEGGYTFPVYYDTDSEGSIQYSVTAIPRTIFITSDGYLEAYASGAIDEPAIVEGIEMILDQP